MTPLLRCLATAATIVAVAGSLACHHRADLTTAASLQGFIRLGASAHRYFDGIDSGAVGVEIRRSAISPDLFAGVAAVLRIDRGEQRCVRQFDLQTGFAFVYSAGCAAGSVPPPAKTFTTTFASFSATRNFTMRVTKSSGNGSSIGNWIAPFEVT